MSFGPVFIAVAIAFTLVVRAFLVNRAAASRGGPQVNRLS
jgi:hypothetical protein